MREWLTPPQVARERGIKPAKVLAFIASGELEAVNHATNRGGKPRWLISRAALDAFERSRSNRAGGGAVRRRTRAAVASTVVANPRSRELDGVIEFF